MNQKYIQDNNLFNINYHKIPNTETIKDCNVENNHHGKNTGVGIEMVTLS